MDTWVEVTKEEFFSDIERHDVSITVEGAWPYVSFFKTPARIVRGRIENGIDYLGIASKYYLRGAS